MVDFSEYFAVIGDCTRMQILHSLADAKSLRAKDILAHVEISQPTLSYHMRVLVEKKIVKANRIGRECFYSIDSDTIESLIDELKTIQNAPEKVNDTLASETVVVKKKNKAKKEEKEKKNKKKKKKDKK
ncbi:MAG: winged helix-turn-helix transcriptional regulator [Clostridiales bacterium]|nr:winged helix-turn-helix transcriptional regulator [Clostridiales bacterium]